MKHNPTQTVSLLVVTRDPSILRPLWSVAEFNAWHLETAGNGWEALERIQSGMSPDILLLELTDADGDALHILRWLRRLRPALAIIALSHTKDALKQREAVRLGAQDSVIHPFDEQKLESAIQRQLSVANVGTEFTSKDIEQFNDDNFFLCTSPAMHRLRTQAELLAQSDVPILITGEPGTGRTTTARLVHTLSLRSGFTFHSVDCANLPEDLLERELFGSGGQARNSNLRTTGKVELSNRGTLFLNGIAELPIDLQAKLFQLIQEKQFVRPGTDTRVAVNPRILAASDVNVEQDLLGNKLREDLYYRLSTFTLHVPPLRERKEEIPFLLHHFMHKLAKYYAVPARQFSAAVLEACQRYNWPGNVRELESFAKRYLMIGDENLDCGRQPPSSNRWPLSATPHAGIVKPLSDDSESEPENKSLKVLIRDMKSEAERNAIAVALEKTGWNRKAAARLLKVSYRTILYKIDQYHLKATGYSATPSSSL